MISRGRRVLLGSGTAPDDVPGDTGRYRNSFYDAADGNSVNEGSTVPNLLFPSPARGQYVWDLAPGPSAISLAISMLVNGCTVVQGNVLGLDCEEEPALGGAPPNLVSTIQLPIGLMALPTTAFTFNVVKTEQPRPTSRLPCDNGACALLMQSAPPASLGVGVDVICDASPL